MLLAGDVLQVLGTALEHVAIDAMSAFHFIETWSAISRDGDRAAVELPFHGRTLLRARSPAVVHPADALSVFCPRLNFSETSAPTATETFSISHDQLASLKHPQAPSVQSAPWCGSAHVRQGGFHLTDRKPLKGSMSPTELRITSWLGMPVYDADFGWGKARVMSRAESVRGGFVYLVDAGPADDGDKCAVCVLMCMEAENMREFERLLYEN
jgi:hypothetical protein